MERTAYLVRLPKRERAMLTVAAKAYRAPSVNWFIGEMIGCMLNPARWHEFSMRLNSGQQQQTLDLIEKATVAPKRRKGRRRD